MGVSQETNWKIDMAETDISWLIDPSMGQASKTLDPLDSVNFKGAI